MTVRDLASADIPKIENLHLTSGFEYALPTFDQKSFPVRRVLSDENGFAMGIFCRKTLEAYFIMDHNWRTPAWRWSAFQTLHEATRLEALQKEYSDVQALIPPEIESRFGKRLLNLGWRKNLWTCFSRDL